MPEATARELKAWRLESGGRGDEPIIGELGIEALRLWAYKHLDPAARKATGRSDVTLYTLRHSHASALHYASFTVPEAAKRMGHSPVVHIQTYAHVIERLSGKRYDGLDALIEAARAELLFPERSPRTSESL